jgi:hypothetical protein
MTCFRNRVADCSGFITFIYLFVAFLTKLSVGQTI